MRCVLEALAALHEADIVYGDVKPSNFARTKVCCCWLLWLGCCGLALGRLVHACRCILNRCTACHMQKLLTSCVLCLVFVVLPNHTNPAALPLHAAPA